MSVSTSIGAGVDGGRIVVSVSNSEYYSAQDVHPGIERG
jgi:hypothetical protein